jgi:hypothetical protein
MIVLGPIAAHGHAVGPRRVMTVDALAIADGTFAGKPGLPGIAAPKTVKIGYVPSRPSGAAPSKWRVRAVTRRSAAPAA